MRIDSAAADMDVAMGMVSAIQEFSEVLATTADARRGCPADDLVSDWVGADFDALQMVHETGLFISGGAETTRTVISSRPAVLARRGGSCRILGRHLVARPALRSCRVWSTSSAPTSAGSGLLSGHLCRSEARGRGAGIHRAAAVDV